MSLQTLLVVILIVLISGLALGLISYLLRPNRQRDVMQQAIGDAPKLPRGGYLMVQDGIGREFTNFSDLKHALEKERFPRGGYAVLGEQAPIAGREQS